MKLLRFLPVLLAIAAVFGSCQKELSYEGGIAVGTLKDDGAGDCLPVIINGTYTKNVILGSANYVDIQADIAQTGAYLIKTDTINGYSFSASGNFAVAGLNTIRLVGSGKPIAAGVDVFTAEFSETTCQFNIVVNGAPATTADFTLGSTAGVCTGATLAGTYMQGLAMSSANTVTLNVNVTTVGSYSLSVAAVNGVSFSGSGTFTATGPQTVVLTGSGTPAAAGTFTYPVTAGTSNCSFDVTYSAAAGPAVYTLSCGTPTFAGTYQAGTPMTASNTMTVGVNVTSGGTYSITTTAVNGVTFAGTGVLPATPASQTVTLTATGTPAASGTFTYTLSGASTTCTVPVTYTAAAGPAAYTLSCGTPVLAGTYQAGTAMTASNTMTVGVNVTTIGSYTVTAAAQNGVSFSVTGSFTTTGPQNIVLVASGTPTAAGTFTYTLNGASTTCTVPVTYTAAGPTDYVRATVDGVPITFYFDMNADSDVGTTIPGYTYLSIEGFQAATGSEEVFLEVAVAGTSIPPGTYTLNQAPNSLISGDYTNAAGDNFNEISGATPQSSTFSITITSISATRVTGTFSGPLRQDATGPAVKTITNGQFSLPLP